jgi:uncharacterized protein YdaU (DUF1376 family)
MAINVNYYYFHLGDYASHTGHLDPLEDIAYRRLLDLYYRQERPLDNSIPELARLTRLREHEAVIETILTEFFSLTAEGWRHFRCDEEIGRTLNKVAKARASGEASGRARRQKGTDVERTLNERSTEVELPIPNTHNPIPSTQYPIKKEKAPPFDFDAVEGLDRATFEKWLAYRKEIGKALKPASIEAAARDMARYGSQQAVVVQQSIAQGWQGLFAIKVVTGAQVPADPEGLALKKLTDRRQAIGLASFRLPNAHELSKDYRAAQDKAWMEAKSEKAEEPAPVDTSRNVARVSGLLQGFGRMGVAK